MIFLPSNLMADVGNWYILAFITSSFTSACSIILSSACGNRQLPQSQIGTRLDPYEKKLLSITAMQKCLGKSRFDELLTAYIEKPQGKPTLVPESNKRSAMNNAKTDFMEEN